MKPLHALLRTLPPRSGCNRSPLRAGLLSFSRSANNSIPALTKELPIPPEALSHRSVEMIRVWLANEQQHVVLNIGFWEDRGIDERSAWGTLLADMIHHIANAHQEEYGHNISETVDMVKAAFLAELSHSTTEHMGGFVRAPQRDDEIL